MKPLALVEALAFFVMLAWTILYYALDRPRWIYLARGISAFVLATLIFMFLFSCTTGGIP